MFMFMISWWKQTNSSMNDEEIYTYNDMNLGWSNDVKMNDI